MGASSWGTPDELEEGTERREEINLGLSLNLGLG